MASATLRIFSDLHYGDRGSRLHALADLEPLFDGAAATVFNGDTIDTRPSRDPAVTAALRTETLEFIRRTAPAPTILTGNHDPDLSDQHTLDLAGGRVFVTHGDVIFDDLVPWGQDAATIRERLVAEFERLPPERREDLAERLLVYRRVAATIPQRHQSERNGLKYLVSFLSDTIWPPTRVLRVINAWRRAPGLAAELTRHYRPQARFCVIGHIHHPGCWQMPNGVIVLNTGSFCPPNGAAVVDISADRVQLREVERAGRGFRLGATRADFPLAR